MRPGGCISWRALRGTTALSPCTRMWISLPGAVPPVVKGIGSLRHDKERIDRRPFQPLPLPRHPGERLARTLEHPGEVVSAHAVMGKQDIEDGIAEEIVELRLFPSSLHRGLLPRMSPR